MRRGRLLAVFGLFVASTLPASAAATVGGPTSGGQAGSKALDCVLSAGTPHAWFYYAVLPCALNGSTSLAASIEPDGIHPGKRPPPGADLSHPIWLDVWRDGQTNVAQLRAGNFDPATDIPRAAVRGDSVYVFYAGTAAALVDTAPVARRTPGGWAWQQLQTVEWGVRESIRVGDPDKGAIVDGTGAVIADLRDVFGSADLKGRPVVDLGCLAAPGHCLGLLGEPARPAQPAGAATAQPSQPALPYRSLYRYETTSGMARKVTRLPAAATTGLPPALAARIVPGAGDVVSYSRPVADALHGDAIFYWYCVESAGRPDDRAFALVRFDAGSAEVIDAFTTRRLHLVGEWSGKDWTPENRSLDWLYGDALNLRVQPIVGTDSSGNVVVYGPDMFRTVQYRKAVR